MNNWQNGSSRSRSASRLSSGHSYDEEPRPSSSPSGPERQRNHGQLRSPPLRAKKGANQGQLASGSQTEAPPVHTRASNSKSEVDYFETNRFWSCILHFTELKDRLPEGLHIQRTNDGFIITSNETPTIAIAVPVYNMEETMNVTKLPDSAQLVFKTRLQPNNKPDSRCSIMNGTIFCYCNLCVAEMQQQNTSKQPDVKYIPTAFDWTAIVRFRHIRYGRPAGLKIQGDRNLFIITSDETEPAAVFVPDNIRMRDIKISERYDSAELVFNCEQRPVFR
ncbi:uncharacterized protein LOC142351853 [Convolutriloba macropyga]|uniref:uncharacterized protein LOC142351853 n=1 Tax=Convolutriloba macropyga TaxID=536237 RepID=UPI003F524F6D